MSIGLARRGAVAVRRTVAAAGVTDTFTRADSTTTLGSTETGQAWEVFGGGGTVWGISSNQAYRVSGSDGSVARVDTGVTDQTVTATITTDTSFQGLVVRSSSTDNFYLFDRTPTAWRIFRCVTGNFTQLGSGSVDSAALTMRYAAVGSSMTATFLPSTVVASLTDTGITTGTFAGFRHGGANNTPPRYDDFTVV